MSHQHHYSPPRDQFIEVLRTKQMPETFLRVSGICLVRRTSMNWSRGGE